MRNIFIYISLNWSSRNPKTVLIMIKKTEISNQTFVSWYEYLMQNSKMSSI